jgi:hypothetical protein
MLDQNKTNAKLTVLEKTAISIIVILIIVILLLIFNKQIKEYIEIFKNWYESA